ncbi:hypothetical protein MKZ38_000243 [Zalerion maritima]|uniref:Uncharacterized protein n=1 Tax=Zalerion maritima TaxID=339359 RepID=A0AAD5RT14_9PEZI|nr:hypothetical protein MKZ38_000243 [Zalerion maritima]
MSYQPPSSTGGFGGNSYGGGAGGASQAYKPEEQDATQMKYQCGDCGSINAYRVKSSTRCPDCGGRDDSIRGSMSNPSGNLYERNNTAFRETDQQGLRKLILETWGGSCLSPAKDGEYQKLRFDISPTRGLLSFTMRCGVTWCFLAQHCFLDIPFTHGPREAALG